MEFRFAGQKYKLRVPLIEVLIWFGLYLLFVIPISLGTTNTEGNFSQPHGNSLWAPLLIGGSTNILVMYFHAFHAFPLLLTKGRRTRYLIWIAGLFAAYMILHLVYQIGLAWTVEVNLRHITVLEWSVENTIPLPVVVFVSVIYKIIRDWIGHTRVTKGLMAKSHYLESELRLVRNQVREIQQTDACNESLWFESNRERIQIRVGDIKFIKAAGNYIEINTAERMLIVYGSLKGVLERLPKDHFSKCHRSYIVNNESVKAVIGKFVSLGNEQIPIGAAYRKNVLKTWRN